VPTFEKAEAVCFAEKHEIWRSHDPENGRRRAMDRYVLPRIGAMPVDKVGSAAVYEVLRPIASAGKQACDRPGGGDGDHGGAGASADRGVPRRGLAGGDDAPLVSVVRPGGSGVNYPELGRT